MQPTKWASLLLSIVLWRQYPAAAQTYHRLHAGKLSPFKFYQYLVGNVPDVDVIRFLKMLTFLPLERIEALQQVRSCAVAHPGTSQHGAECSSRA